MNHEILFRGKDICNGNWIVGSLIVYPQGQCEIHHFGKYPFEHKRIDVRPETVGQFTGLTDKNGKLIFEGDIVKHFHEFYNMDNYMIREVWWDKENCCFRLTTPNGISGRIIAGEKYEVIGNRWDNPEMLEGGAGCGG